MLNLEIVGQGATTKIYRDGGTAIKLYINAPPDEAEIEAERQRFAFAAGLPVPAVYGIRKLNDNAVALDMEYISGKPLIYPGMNKNERNGAILTMTKLQREVHKVRAHGLPKLSERLNWKIRTTMHLEEPQKDKLLTLHTRLDEDSDHLCHGDFHPLNILFDGAKHWIIDWVDATSWNPSADACRTYLIFKQYMSRSAGVYLEACCNTAKVKQGDVLAWLPVIAAARLTENLDDASRLWLIDVAKGPHRERL
jgi:tRNA A-37 threonylcarbamoyl transferase component Bud32